MPSQTNKRKPRARRTKADFRPRRTDALVVAPVAVTDRTCAAVLGFEPREFRDWLADVPVRHRRKGQRVIALVADCVAALESESESAVRETEGERTSNVDSLLARIGRTRVRAAS
jgi:hypothetical protein